MASLHWLEDFNDPAPDPVVAPADDLPAPAPPPPDPRAEAWNDGFLSGCRVERLNREAPNHALAAELTRRIADLEASLAETAANSAALMGGLLIDLLVKALPDDWPPVIRERLASVTAAVRPVFTLDPRLQVHTDPPGEIAFRDLPGLYKALETAPAADWPLGVRWETEAVPEAVINHLKTAIAGRD